MRRFVDTNVLVYAHDPADRRKQQIARATLLDHADALVVSAQVLSELYSVLTRPTGLAMRGEDAREIVDELRGFPVVPVDDQLVLDGIGIALEARVAYWDGLILAAARTGGCEVLLSEDLSHGATVTGVTIENPFLTG